MQDNEFCQQEFGLDKSLGEISLDKLNVDGGAVALGHPVGATGVKQAAEIFRQMKGLCGDYQLPKTPQRGLTVNMGGDDRTVVSLVIEDR